MSIQELQHQNSFDGTISAVGNIDIFARTVSASSITLDKPYLNKPSLNIYQWSSGQNLSPTPSQAVNGVISCLGAVFGTIYIPNTNTLDTYFGTTSRGYSFYTEIINYSSTDIYIVSSGMVTPVIVPQGTLHLPTYYKLFFSKLVDNGPYVCINTNNA